MMKKNEDLTSHEMLLKCPHSNEWGHTDKVVKSGIRLHLNDRLLSFSDDNHVDSVVLKSNGAIPLVPGKDVVTVVSLDR